MLRLSASSTSSDKGFQGCCGEVREHLLNSAGHSECLCWKRQQKASPSSSSSSSLLALLEFSGTDSSRLKSPGLNAILPEESHLQSSLPCRIPLLGAGVISPHPSPCGAAVAAGPCVLCIPHGAAQFGVTVLVTRGLVVTRTRTALPGDFRGHSPCMGHGHRCLCHRACPCCLALAAAALFLSGLRVGFKITRSKSALSISSISSTCFLFLKPMKQFNWETGALE